MKRYLVFLSFMLAAAQLYAADVSYTVSDITETRSNKDEFFNSMRVQLNITGEGIKDAESIKVTAVSAVDDTGRDLIKKDRLLGNKFSEVSNGQGTAEVELASSSRKAAVIKEMACKLEIYSPSLDPASTVRIEGFMKNYGKAVDSPVLKAAQIELTAFDKKTYDELNKDKPDVGQQMSEAMTGMFGSMFGGSDENSVIIKTRDPQLKIIGIKFCDSAGQTINSPSSFSMDDVASYSFERPMPDGAVLIVMLETEKSLKKMPIKFTDVQLP